MSRAKWVRTLAADCWRRRYSAAPPFGASYPYADGKAPHPSKRQGPAKVKAGSPQRPDSMKSSRPRIRANSSRPRPSTIWASSAA